MSIFLVFFSILSRAETCANKNLHTIPNSVLNKMPIYDQDGTGICYAYTATQLINYSLLSQNNYNGPLVDPINAAWTTYYKAPFFKDKKLKGGEVEDVFNAISNEGVCQSKDAEKILSSLETKTNMSLAQILASLNVFYELQFKQSKALSDRIAQVVGIYSQDQCQLKKKTNYQALLENLKELNLDKMASTEILSHLYQDCSIKKINLSKLETKYTGSDHELSQIISEQLTQNKPIVASICLPVLTNSAEFRGLRGFPIRQLEYLNYGSSCRPHSVVISGSKVEKIPGSETNQCLYLVRNSWGAFNRPAAAQACACITKYKTYKDNCSVEEVSQYVGCWYRTQDILANTTDLEYLK